MCGFNGFGKVMTSPLLHFLITFYSPEIFPANNNNSTCNRYHCQSSLSI